MSQPARKLPPNAIVCPHCGSPDTAKYKWPDDPQSKIFQAEHPDTKVCVDCRYVWWSDSQPSND
jgi:RNA polymerase subunit RPABC4/transcription elongation factor Spt4